MTKSDLIKLYAETTGLPASQAGEYFERLCDIVTTELLAGGEVSLPRIGKLSTRKLNTRQGRNPKTGAAITIAAHRKLVISASKDLKEALQ